MTGGKFDELPSFFRMLVADDMYKGVVYRVLSRVATNGGGAMAKLKLKVPLPCASRIVPIRQLPTQSMATLPCGKPGQAGMPLVGPAAA